MYQKKSIVLALNKFCIRLHLHEYIGILIHNLQLNELVKDYLETSAQVSKLDYTFNSLFCHTKIAFPHAHKSQELSTVSF